MPPQPLRRPHAASLRAVLPLALALAAVSGCSESSASGTATRPDSADITAYDTATVQRVLDSVHAPAAPAATAPQLSPRADSIGRQLTFYATFQGAFVGAARARRLLVDLGHVNVKLATPQDRRAYAEAVRALSPVRIGDRLRLHGPWGSDDAVVDGYDSWNGRIVATVQAPPTVDSLARHASPLVVLAVRADSAQPPAPDSCVRDSVPATLAARLPIIRDSLSRLAAADTAHFPASAMRTHRVDVTQATGCFGSWRALVFAAGSAGGYMYARERAVLVDTAGVATPVQVADVRFHAHQLLEAFDADGDGVDDVAAIGRGEHTGGTVVLRFDPAKRRLDYVMSGFSWESY